ncbi:MAG: hypothetical protein JW936_08140 [Sedimentisphaerales bacterium]|nr:hypothetical protein [Sedimentisphaerales bacterium]
MSLTKWFRKNNKKLLAFVGVAIMIGFLLPNFTGSGRRGGKDTVAFVTINGEEHECTNVDLSRANQDIQILQALQVPLMYAPSERGLSVICQLPDLGWINDTVVLATNSLLFGDTPATAQIGNRLYQTVVSQGQDWAEQEALADGLGEIMDLRTSRSNVLYYLLLKEAESMGLQATNEQVEMLLEIRGQLIAARLLQPISIGSIVERVSGTEGNMKLAIRNYLTILECVHALTRDLAVSEPELRTLARNEAARRNVDGTYVAVEADWFASDVAAPTDAELEAQFELYKSVARGDVTDDNPRGFGYKLPDRVQVEYLYVDLAEVESAQESQFAALSAVDQEARVRQYWEENRALFAEAVGRDELGMISYRNPSFDEVEERARALYLASAAYSAAEAVLTSARQSARANGAEANGSEPMDCAALAESVSTDLVRVVPGGTEYLSYAAMQQHEDFGRVYRMRGEQPDARLVDLLFGCIPLLDEEDVTYNSGALDLHDSLGPLTAFAGAYDPRGTNTVTGLYVLTLTGADKSREPVSLEDDGRSGGADAAPIDGESTLRAQVADDVRSLAAFDLAEARMDVFVAAAATDWDGAVAQLNADLNDPNKVVFSNTISATRSLLDQIENGVWGGDLPRGELQRVYGQSVSMIRLAADEAGSLGASDTGLVMAADEGWGRWLVFRDLAVEPLTAEEYETRRAMIAQRWLDRAQNLAVVSHLRPDNIKARMGFRWREAESGEASESE